ncbi:PLP-dependent aminotransferase family protein [Fulvimarina sp. MAC8]|uniref:aminotransferase-like domain-containing protein n=1 Tax=Fulvimarina sp. MAC8 TaxID=3162874 RepID=UPI0032EE2EC0
MDQWKPDLPQGGKPHYLAIADALEADIRNGRLKAGDRLPPQRRLAKALGIDFTTVSRAYGEAATRSLLESHVGRGTFVAARAPTGNHASPARMNAQDLSMNMPPEPSDPALIAKMQDGLDVVSANLIPLLRYQPPAGTDRDKIAASSWLSMRGMVPKLERIAVTPGAHATMTAILSVVTEPGDTVLCEAVTYSGIRGIARMLRLNLVGIEMDEDGILPDALVEEVERHKPKALYLNPTIQNPTTITMPTARRLAVADIINEYRLPTIEDDAYGFIPPKAPAPLAVSAPDYIWHIGGLAKCIGAGLRLAYTVAPSGRAAITMEQALKAASGMASPIAMALATRWIEDGTADYIRRFIRAESAARQETATEVLNGFDFKAEPHAFNIWLCLPPDSGGRASLMGRMAGRPLGLMPSDVFTVSGPPGEYVRVCLGGPIARETLRGELAFLANSLHMPGWAG